MSYIKFKKTKIVATLGPGCNSKTMLSRLIKAGVNVFRINFSHASYEEANSHIDLIRSLSEFISFFDALSAQYVFIPKFLN